MNESNSYPLRVEKLIPAKAKCPYYEGFRWAQPDEEHLIHLMRHVYNNRDEAATKGERAATEILGQWTWRQAANRMRNRLLAIAEERR
jgi:hypothetical protein